MVCAAGRINAYRDAGAAGADTSTLIFLSPRKKLCDDINTAASIATMITAAMAQTTLLPVLFPSSAMIFISSPLPKISQEKLCFWLMQAQCQAAFYLIFADAEELTYYFDTGKAFFGSY